MSVSQFLGSITRLEWAELLASEQVDPDPHETLIEVVKLGFSAIVSAMIAEEISPNDFDPRDLDEPKPTDPDTQQQRDVDVLKSAGLAY